MKLREIMRPAPLTVRETTHLWDAYQLMTEHRIRHLPVMRGDHLCGMLSERDILAYRANTAFRERPARSLTSAPDGWRAT